MKVLLKLVLTATLISAQGAWADRPFRTDRDYAKVLSAEPIYETISYSEPYRECRYEEYPRYHSSGSNTAVVVGSIIGGAIGHKLGHRKSNKQVGAVAGAVLGGAIAKDMQRDKGSYSVRTERVCTVSEQTYYREEITGYNVLYKYRGRIYHTVTEEDPGQRIPIEISVRPARY